MLYYIKDLDVQLLVAGFCAVMLYAGLLTVFIPRRVWFGALFMTALFAFTYMTLINSGDLLGKPKWTDDERVGQLGGYVIFEHSNQKWIALLLKTDTGPELVAVPYKGTTESELSDSMNRFVKGQGQIVRKRPGGTISSDKTRQGNREDNDKQEKEGDLEFYEFNEDFLVPKSR